MAISLHGYQPQQATTSINPAQRIRLQIKTDVTDLSNALQSGDLATAQKSYADLQKIIQNSGAIGQAAQSPTASQASSGSSAQGSPLAAIANDFQALGHDLQSGDLSTAQKDYAQLATDSQQVISQQQQQPQGTGATGGHHHHHADNDADDAASSSSSSTATSPTPAQNAASAYQFTFTASFQASSSNSPDPLNPDIQNIGKDLQSGDLIGAQKDYAQLVTDAQKLFASNGATNSAYQYSLTASYESATATSANQSGTTQSSNYALPNAQQATQKVNYLG